MLIRIISIYIALLCFVLAQKNDFITFKLDALGQSEFYLNEINPYSQSDFKIGTLKLDGLDHIPYSSSRIDFNFISEIDTSNVTSQFNYSRGDYSFRETKILANNPLSDNRNLLFKAHGRKYPGIYSSLGTDYILQNYLIDYRAITENKLIEITKFYHKEDINLPIIQSNKRRLSEIDGLGISLSLFSQSSLLDNKYDLKINYQNIFYNGGGYNSQEEPLELALQKNEFSAFYSVYINNKLSSHFYIAHKIFESTSLENLNSIYLNEIRWDYRYAFSKHSFEVGFHSFGNYFADNIYPIFSYTFKIGKTSQSNWSLNLKRDYYFEPFNIINTLSENSKYYLFSLIRESQKTEFNLSLFKIDLESRTGAIEESGSLLKFSSKIGNQKDIDFHDKMVSFFDIVNLSLIFHNYSNYGPIDYNLNFKLKTKYLESYKFNKYSPYLNFEVNYISLILNSSISLDSSGSLFGSQGSEGISYQTSKIEIGLIFNDFIVSYNILNAGPDYYFPDGKSNINIPIYQMNYLNVKWQFQD